MATHMTPSIWIEIVDDMKRNGVNSEWFKEAVRFLTDFLNWLNSSLPLNFFSQHHQLGQSQKYDE